MPLSTFLDRARGTLLGLAVGDALGAPLEGLSPQQIRAHYGSVVDYVDGARAWKRKPYRWRLPGLYTDDTQQALALTETLITRGTVDADHLATIYLDLANPRNGHAGAHRGIGRSFRLVLDELERGRPPLECGQDSAGIGAAMRIAPAAIAFLDDPDGLFDAVMTASLMTHRDIRSLSGAVAVASAVRRLLTLEPRSASLLFRVAADVATAETRIAEQYGHLVDSIDEHGRSLSRAIANVESLLDLPRPEALAVLVEEANAHGARPVCKRPTMGFPPACIPTCFYLLLTTESLEEALIDVVNLGGDADSTGAILGALAGAHYGLDALPDRWLDGLRNRQGIDLRAQALALGSAQGLEIPDLIAIERHMSLEESNYRERLLAANQRGGMNIRPPR
ncbi:ADP-ribosylglycohydrolase family protein [Tautonia rosea]|uniref:ADP-ribosylglycohydrolase family protein n=1 Tax=Tautonia rosea TaxID=2728037 RepID=UPI001472B7DA|nr:ADP-ribosylglycohydrolase family protein [Tautonia rosea]